jgi:hypothetical protein
MKYRRLICAAMLAFVSVVAVGQISSTIVGTWQGDKRGSPWVTLHLTREKDGELSGTGVFFILDRNENNGPPKVLGRQEVQLVNPKVEGHVLSFRVRNQQGGVTMNPSSGETLGFHMTLNDESGILKSDDPGTPSLKMVKQK